MHTVINTKRSVLGPSASESLCTSVSSLITALVRTGSAIILNDAIITSCLTAQPLHSQSLLHLKIIFDI